MPHSIIYFTQYQTKITIHNVKNIYITKLLSQEQIHNQPRLLAGGGGGMLRDYQMVLVG